MQFSDQEHRLAGKLRSAVLAATVGGDAIAYTRSAIVTLGAQLASRLALLPAADLSALGIGLLIVLRGTPTVEDVPGLPIEYLPALDDAGFDARPGATALSLEALGSGSGRFYLEVRSNPGDITLATSPCESLNAWLIDVRGIFIDDTGAARLVNERAGKDGFPNVAAGADADAILEAFIDALLLELQRRARFNRAADLRGLSRLLEKKGP
jgi:hypothetical protein